METNQPQNLS